jgi:hypothetical protein
MAVIRLTGAEPPLRIMSPQSLFYGLFFGLGGGILLFAIVIGLIYWRITRSGRIRLGSGAPGELDDEQRLLEEERSAMEQLDPSQQEAYYRAKGDYIPPRLSFRFAHSRISREISSRECDDGYFIISVLIYPGERSFGVGIYTRGFGTVIKCICAI